MRVIRLQYQIMMMRMLGVRNVFMANHTWVKPPFWWMPYRQNHAVVNHEPTLADATVRCRKEQTSAYNKSDVFDFSDPHVDLLALVYREADVEKIVFVGHTADLHEGQEVTVVATTLVIHGLEGHTQRDIESCI